MSEGITSSEKFVYSLCQDTFLSLWSFVNPIGKKGKELCDILIVCDPHIIVISVKDIKFESPTEEDYSIASERWIKRAIENSNKQINGAVRFVQQADFLLDKNRRKIDLPPKEKRIYHRIAIAFGSQSLLSFSFMIQDEGKGITHVLNEESTEVLLEHLNTVSDFVQYLLWKEEVIHKIKSVLLLGGEEDLLAAYLSGELNPVVETDFLTIEENIWEQFLSSPQYQAKLREDAASYIWDNLIEMITKNHNPYMEIPEHALNDLEQGIRAMALENRYFRRNLAKNYRDFLENAKAGKTRSRMFFSPQGKTGYIWLCGTKNDTQKIRHQELYMRCIASLVHMPPEIKTVVGISSNTLGQVPDEESAIEIVTFKTEDKWPSKLIQLALQIKQELNYFNTIPIHDKFDYEFPPVE